MAVDQSTNLLNVNPLSQASQLPQFYPANNPVIIFTRFL
jgi:hypothetical protein